MDEIGRSYLSLALCLDRHVGGFVDAYFGPPELKGEIEAAEPRPLQALADEACQLEAAIRAGGYDDPRKDFVLRQTQAMAAVIRTLSGERLDFVEQVELYFDIRPEMVDEAVFESAHAEIAHLLPEPGPLVERMASWKKRLELEPGRILPVFDLACRAVRGRTAALFDLPSGEALSLELVKDQPWGAYNWYLGAYRSRIEINTDLPVRAESAVPLMAHEAYPGHHTEHAIKESRLYRQQGRPEHAIQLLLAPECVVSEGIGDSAQGVIFEEAELAALLHDELYPLAGLADIDVEKQMRLSRAAEGLRAVSGNAGLLMHRDGRPVDEVRKYLEQYALRTPQEAAQTLRFIENPLWSSYIFNYTMGKALLAPLLQGPQTVANFGRLLGEPFTPSQIRQWLVEQNQDKGTDQGTLDRPRA